MRVEAGRLRRLLHNYYLGPGRNDPLIISVPKGAYVPSFAYARDERTERSATDNGPQKRASDTRAGTDALTMPRGPSIVVLPFSNISTDPEQAVFSDGLSEEITTQLARFSTLFVVARHTAFQYKDKNIDLRDIGRDLEVHYVLEGSVRASDTVIRITAQLIDATTGLHVWAENYDRELTAQNLISLQDDIAQAVVAAIAEPHGVISRYDLARARRRQCEDMDLYTYILRWYEYARRYDAERRATLQRETQRMLQRHPKNSLVWTVRGLLALDDEALTYDEQNDGSGLNDALAYLGKAIQLDPSNAKAYQYLIMTRFMLDDLDGAFDAGRQAMRLNPNDSDLIGEYGTFRCFGGDWERGLEFVNKAIALNPRHSPVLFGPMCLDHYRRGEYEAALKYAERYDLPGLSWSHALRAMTLGQLGRTDAAAAAVADLVNMSPGFPALAGQSFRRFLKEEPLVERCLEGLRKAGLDLP